MSDLNRIKEELEKKLQELTLRAEKIDDDLSQPGDDDWEEKATESEDDEVLEEVGEMTVDEIHQIKLALLRIESGDDGTCQKCGSAIGGERLQAIPYATRCVKCS